MKEVSKLSKTTKEKILHCAIEEFIDSGFHGARMQSIADRAKVNKAMLFYYYTSKEQIYREVLSTVFSAISRQLNSLGDEPLSVKEKIGQIVDVYYGALLEHPDYVKLVLYEFISGAAQLKEIVSTYTTPYSPVSGKVYKYFQEKMDSGAIVSVDIFQLILSIVGQIIIPLIGRPIFESMSEVKGKNYDDFIKERKIFIVQLICDGIIRREK